MMILLIGGSACGKSAYAESLCLRLPQPRTYLATMKPYGDEGMRRIARHRSLREGKGFTTLECYTDLSSLELDERGTVLLECVANLVANEMFDDRGGMVDPYDRVVEGIMALRTRCDDLVVVSNDVGSEPCAYDEGTMSYIAAIGRINAALAERAEAVFEMVCGIPLVLKGELI